MKKALIALGILVLCLIAFLWFRETRLFAVGMDGFMFPGEDIKISLTNGGEAAASYEAVKVEEDDDIFSQRREYFVDNGKERKRVDIDLPVVSKDGAKVLVLGGQEAISDKFVTSSTFRGVVIAGGTMYNLADNDQVDREKYLFLKSADKIYMNLFDLAIKKATGEVVVPANSLVFFERNALRYYSLDRENAKYVFHEVTGIDLNDEVAISDGTLSYVDLLKKIGTWSEGRNEDNEEKEDSGEETSNGGQDGPTYEDKLEVSGKLVGVDVYSATFSFYIHNPKGEIVRFPTVEIYDGEKVQARKTFYETANSVEIVGLVPNKRYTYKIFYTVRDSDERLVKKTIASSEFTTSGLDNLETVTFQYASIAPKTNDVTILGLKLGNGGNDRVLRGLSKVVLEVDGQEFSLSSNAMNSLKKGESVNYTSPSILKSNTPYHVELKAYDVAGNSLRVSNGSLDIKTTKAAPISKLTVKETDFAGFKAELEVNNPDDVNLENLRYVILDGNQIVREKNLAGNTIHEQNLADNKVYQVLVYADYDLSDGAGIRQNQLLSDVYVTTTPISMLGNLRLVMIEKSITEDEANFDFSINTRTTDARLISLLQTITLYFEKQDGEIAKTFHFEGDDLYAIKMGEKASLIGSELDSNTDYSIRGEATFGQGDMVYDVEVALSIRAFKTRKQPAVVEVIDKFTTSSTVDYTVRVVDPDGSVAGDYVMMQFGRMSGETLAAESLKTNEGYRWFSYNKLDNNTEFEIIFTADVYNEGYTDATAESGKILATEKLMTRDSVSGNIALESLLRQRTGKNHYEIENSQRWKDVSLGGGDSSTVADRSYDLENEVTFLSAKNGYRYYSYFLPELAGKNVTVSFDAKLEETGSDAFVANVANDDASISSCQLTGLSDNYKHYSCTFTLGAKGYVGFFLQEVSAENRLSKLAIKKLQIEEGDEETYYERYQGKDALLATVRVNLEDLNREIPNNDYYIKVYKAGELTKEIRQSLDESGKAVKQYIDFDADPNASYTARLTIRINDVDFDIDSTEFTTEAEIRSVHNLTEFKNMHITGKYFVVEDIDLRGQGTLYQNFYGSIEFQGNRLDINIVPSYYIRNFYGTLTNADIHVYLSSASSSVYRWHWGLTESNYGTFSNIFVTIEESIPGSNYYSIATMARWNYGVIENFVLHLKVSMYGIHTFSPFVLENHGTIKNGYAYGDEGVSIEPHYVHAYESNPKRVGVFASRQGSSGRLENVFSLVDVDGDEDSYDHNYEYVANLIGYADVGTTISHVYSNADGKYRNTDIDINWYPASGYDPSNPSNYTVEKMYYVLSEQKVAEGVDYAKKGSTRISLWALRDVDFQNDTLNSDEAFDVDSYVPYGYYPHLILSEVMPNQPYIRIPVDDEKTKPDVVSVLNIEQESNSSALVTLNVRNPSAHDITEIRIDKLTTEIVSQTYSNLYTKLVVRVSNPTQYLSTYSVMSISNGSTRTYGVNERNIDVEMYREVSNVSDWQEIKNYPNENYKLVSDIDFNDVAPGTLRVTGSFKGKLDGNGHTIKNIKIDSGNAMIENLNGIIMNLYVENYKMISGASRAGFVMNAQRGGHIVNVHIKNVELLGNDYIGGLAAYLEGATIQDSSVNKITLYNIDRSVSQTLLGGMVGRMTNSSTIENSFVENLDFDIRKAPNIYAVGGLVGQVSSGIIDNVFTTGKIQTKTPSNGGIVGQAENYGSLMHAYSTVDIFSSSNMNIGGIVGELTNPARYTVSNTLSTGSIYSSLSGGAVRRVLGGDVVVSLPNFAWSGQHINGITNEDTSGEVLMTTADLNIAKSYTNLMEMGNSFCYDEIGDNSLPTLYYKNSTNKLPNQDKNYLKSYGFEIKNIEITQGVDSQGRDNAKIYMEINNPSNAKITDVKIEDVETSVLQNDNRNGVTYYRMEVKPTYYYDSYRLSEIKFKENNKEYSVDKDTKIEMQFFRDLWNVNDWQNIDQMGSENYRLRADIDFSGVDINRDLYINRLDGFENGYTLRNISFSDSGDNVGLFHVINSSLYNVTFENVNITNTGSGRNTGLVLFQYGRAERLTFNNINIIGTSSNYVGISADNFCTDTRDITVNNATIKGTTRVGGYAGRIKPFSVTNVNLTDVNVTGTANYVGSFAGEQWTPAYLLQYGIVARHVTVSGVAYVGGIYGYGIGSNLKITSNDAEEWSLVNAAKSGSNTYAGGISGRYSMSIASSATGIYTEKTTIKGSGNYIGGIVGYADRGITNSTAKNITIDGKGSGNYVGGITGFVNSDYNATKLTVGGESTSDAVKIQNVVTGVGGICGNSCHANSNVVNHLTINATGTAVGGINGYSYNVSSSLVRNSSISGGSYVGGAVGSINGRTVSHVAVVNTEVSGNNIVGGLLGGSRSDSGNYTNIHNSTVNATKVTAANDDAGGLIGSLNSVEYTTVYKGTTTWYNRRTVYNNIVEKSEVTAQNNASGLIGKIDVGTAMDGLQSNRIHNDIVVASLIKTNNSSKDPGVFFGNDDNLAYAGDTLRATDLMVYEGMRLQKGTDSTVVVSGYSGNNFNSHSDRNSKLLTLTQLKTQETYTDLGFTTGNYVYSEVGTYFPYNKNVNGLANVETSQLRVSYPSLAATNGLLGGTRSLMFARNVSYHVMPTYEVYPSDVNTINVEFSSIDADTKFSLNGQEYTVDRRVFSFNYNYDEELSLVVTDGASTKEETLQPQDLRGTLAVVDNNYYILTDGGDVVTNASNIDKKVVNIFNNKVLTEDKKIISLATGEETAITEDDIIWIETDTPLYKFERADSTVQTFLNYSVVGSGGEVEKQILIKGSQTELLDASLKNKKTQVVMDSYNDKNYLTILGDDGVIYDLKEELTYPDSFEKEHVVEISNNVRDFSRIMAVKYDDGRVVVFDYQTGNVIYRLQSGEAITPMEYFIKQVSTTDEHYYDGESLQSGRAGAEEMTAEIKKGTVVSNANTILASGDYLTAYNPVKNEYEIFESSELLSVDPLGAAVSVSDKIYGDNTLNTIFGHLLQHEGNDNTAAIVIYAGIGATIVISMTALGDLLRKKYSKLSDEVIE